MQKYHGVFSIGLLTSKINLEGAYHQRENLFQYFCTTLVHGLINKALYAKG